MVLSQEATAALARAAQPAGLHLRRRSTPASPSCADNLGQPVFHPAVNLRDDPTDPRGLPFPFDLLGAAARPVDLVAGGVALTPAVDDRLARELGLPPHRPARGAGRGRPRPPLPAARRAPPRRSCCAPPRAGSGWRPSTRSKPTTPAPCASAPWPAAPAWSPAARSAARSPTWSGKTTCAHVLAQVLAVGSDLVPIATGAGLFRATTAPMLAVADVGGLRFALD